MIEEFYRLARVFTRNELNFVKNFDRSLTDVAQISNGCCDKEERSHLKLSVDRSGGATKIISFGGEPKEMLMQRSFQLKSNQTCRCSICNSPAYYFYSS